MLPVADALRHFFDKHSLNASAYTVVLRADNAEHEHRLRCALLAEADAANFGFRRVEAADTSKIELMGIKFVITTLDESRRA